MGLAGDLDKCGPWPACVTSGEPRRRSPLRSSGSGPRWSRRDLGRMAPSVGCGARLLQRVDAQGPHPLRREVNTGDDTLPVVGIDYRARRTRDVEVDPDFGTGGMIGGGLAPS